jgi:hypothetical protein
MAAGLGFKTFNTGDVLSAADTNGYLMQGVWVFADAAARTAAVTSPQEGNMSFLKDTNSTEYYSGSAWVAVAPSGGVSYAGCLVTGNASISCTNNADTLITWNTELFDTNNFHSTATNTGRITIPVAGKYQVYFSHYISQGGAGERASSLFKNGTYYALTTKHASSTSVASVNTMSLTMDLAVNDYLETKVFQDSGANRNLLTADATWYYSWFGVDYLGA